MKFLPNRRETVLDRIAYVSALDLPPGAVIVAKSSRQLTLEQAEALKAEFAKVLPKRKVIVLPPKIELDVVREVKS